MDAHLLSTKLPSVALEKAALDLRGSSSSRALGAYAMQQTFAKSVNELASSLETKEWTLVQLTCYVPSSSASTFASKSVPPVSMDM